MSAIDTAKRIGTKAAEFDWKGQMTSRKVNGDRFTSLLLKRIDETIFIHWINGERKACTHEIFSMVTQLDTPEKLRATITNYPDILDLMRLFPEIAGPSLTENYRRLPFTDDAPEDEIISKILGRQVFWYDRVNDQIFGDKARPKRDKNFMVKEIGHRRALHFMGSIAGLRCPMIDTILSVR